MIHTVCNSTCSFMLGCVCGSQRFFVCFHPHAFRISPAHIEAQHTAAHVLVISRELNPKPVLGWLSAHGKKKVSPLSTSSHFSHKAYGRMLQPQGYRNKDPCVTSSPPRGTLRPRRMTDGWDMWMVKKPCAKTIANL